MVCGACLAIPFAFAGAGSSLASSSNLIYIISLVITLISILIFCYYKYWKKCNLCI